MKYVTRCNVLSLLLIPLLLGASPANRPVSSKVLTLHDPGRNRDVPVKVYYPADGAGAWPVVIFSHGLGGSREGYGYIGEALASHGYVAIHMTHLGSDTSIFLNSRNVRAELSRVAADPANLVNRPADVSFVIDRLEGLNTDDPELKGKIDSKTVGVAGHSFGAYTVLACIGQTFPAAKSFLDPRISAACAISSPTPANPNANLDRAYAGIKIPCLHMTGTLDDLPNGRSKAADRRIPFDHSPSPDTYLLTLAGGDHMTFAGHLGDVSPTMAAQFRALPGTSADPATDATFHPLITQAMTTFFDAYLKHDDGAKNWLATEFPKVLADRGTFERKPNK